MSNRYPDDTPADQEEQLSFESEEFEVSDSGRDLEPLSDLPGLESYDDNDLDAPYDPPSDTSVEKSGRATLSSPEFASESLNDVTTDEPGSGYEDEPMDTSDLPDDDAEEIFSDAVDDHEDEPDIAPTPNIAELPEAEAYTPPSATAAGLPWGLIAAAMVAVLLVGFGAYGVVKERSALQEENRNLNARLATAILPEHFQSTRDALVEMEQRNADLRATVGSLTSENNRLNQSVASLQDQLSNTSVTATPEVSKPATQPTATPAPKPVVAARPKPATQAKSPSNVEVAGKWFVNFGAYGERATAASWAKRLSTATRRATVSDVRSGNRTLYRVRVINLDSRTQASAVARELEKAHRLERLWVGQQ